MPFSRSLRARVLLLVTSMVLLGFAASVGPLAYRAGVSQKAAALKYAEQLAASEAQETTARLESAFGTARALAYALSGLKASGNADRGAADAIQRTVLESTPGILGIWTVWEPDAFDAKDAAFVGKPGHDATGRYLPYWNRGSGQTAVEPNVNYDKPGDGDYYLLPKASGKETLIEPYLYKVSGKDTLITSTVVPIVIDGKFVGVAGVDIALSSLQARIGALAPYGTGFASLISNAGKYVADRDADNVSKDLTGSLAEAKGAIREGRPLVTHEFSERLQAEVTRVFVPVRPGATSAPWSFVVTVPDAEMLADAHKLRAAAVVIGLASLVAVSLGLGLVLERLVLRPLGGEPEVAAALARRVAQGDLATVIDVRRGDSRSLMAALKAMQTQLADVVAGVRRHAEGVATASAQIAQGNGDLSARTESQASSLQQTAASMEALSTTVRLNAENARQASELAGSASDIATRGGEAVSEVVDTMKGISASSQQIANIIGTIDGIAFQTNILALNAAVEAARAGEQGRGFAVVAGEVRTLAQRSAEAAREIKSLIDASVARVEQGTQQVDRAGATMTQVVESIRRVTAIMADISAASQAQSAGVAQVGAAVSQMDHATQQNAALVEEGMAASESLRQQADQLVESVAVFKLHA